MSAGGFHRAYEIVRNAPDYIDISCIDKDPTYFADIISKEKITTYKIPSIIQRLININFIIGKSIEKIYVAIYLVFLISSKYKNYIIYVPFSELMQLSLPAIICKYLNRQRVVFTNLNVNHFFPETIINPYLHQLSDLVITISKSLEEDLKKNGIRAAVINPVGINVTLPKLTNHGTNRYDGIFVGRHTQEKGIFDAIHICKLLNEKTKFKLLCIGDIPDNNKFKIKQLIKQLCQENNIYLEGMVSEEDKYKYFKQSKICLFTSHQEGWGIVPQEALVAGIPVVAYDLGVYQENIAPCPAVYLVEKFDTAKFAGKVAEILEIDSKKTEVNVKKSVEVLKKFSWENIAEKEFRNIIC